MAAEKYTIEQGASVQELMERAGRAVFLEITSRYSKSPIQVICGPGNNGGDGYVVARLLQEAGWTVSVIAPLEPNKAHSYSLWKGETKPFDTESLESGSLMVDAMFGIGLQRDLDNHYAAMVTAMNSMASHIISVDIPSGVHTDSAHIMGFAVEADLTVTFNFRKPGHLLLPGRMRCGEVVLHDIGLHHKQNGESLVYANHPSLWRHLYPLPTELSHKYSRGYLNILGGVEMTGAARLVAMAARRMGIGMTRIESRPESHEIYQAECLGTLTKAIKEPAEFAEEERLTAAVLGPGCGRSHFTKEAVLVWLETEKPCVLDADALYIFKDDPGELFSKLYPGVVLTPHEGEFHHLFDLTGNKIERVQKAAALSGATVLLKGADTVISDPSGLTIIDADTSSHLATGGTGDVLAGMIGALLAQNVPSLAAASIASYTHVMAAQRIGLGLIAEDIPDKIPEILKEILQRD